MRITVFGADWCEDTRRSLRHLRRLGVAYRYLNVDEDGAALERAKQINDGRRRTPAIEVGAETLVEPSNESLTHALVRQGLVTTEDAQYRMRVQNLGDLERALRIAGGLTMLIAAGLAPRAIRRPLRVCAATLAATGAAGWCPGYAAAGVSSLGGPGDRPYEAERPAWHARHSPRLFNAEAAETAEDLSL